MATNKNIHPPYNKFMGWCREHNIKYADLAKILGVGVDTVGYKIRGKSDFTLSEVNILRRRYNLSSQIFFTD